MFTGALCQFGYNRCVTGAAGARRRVRSEYNLPRSVNRMTLEAYRYCLSVNMRFVAGEAGRLETVRCVTRCTGNLRMFARICFELIADGAVAVKAEIGKLGCCGNLSRRVRVRMAYAAVSDLWAVRCFVARGTFWHDCIIIALAGTIGVKDVMAALAVELVFAAVIFQVLKRTGVALGTLTHGEWLRLNGILLRGRRDSNGRDFFPLRRCKRNPGECKYNYCSRQNSFDTDACRCAHFPSLFV